MNVPRIAFARLLVVVVLLVGVIPLPSLAATSPVVAPSFSAEEMERGYRQGRILVKTREVPTMTAEARQAAVDQAEAGAGVRGRKSFRRLERQHVLAIDPAASVPGAMARLRATGLYEFVEPDFIRIIQVIPNDTRFGDQWSLNNTGQSSGTPDADIDAPEAWDNTSDASSVIVAVIDTGLRVTHEDIAANLWRNSREIAGNSRDDDNNGYVDDLNGINSIVAGGSATSGTPADDNGHGSHVAGIIGAVGNNGRGVTGVAWKVQIMPLKFLGTDGRGSVSDAAECIDYAIANGAQVINASYGALSTGQGPSQTEISAIQRARSAGIVFVAAAGNDGLNLDVARTFPANYAVDNIVAVGNSTRLEDIATSSNTGSGAVELFAPGSEILSLSQSSDSAYVVLSGTSMASPHVAGAVALLRARYPGDTYRQTINRLLRSVDPVAKYSGRVQTGGRLNLQKALAQTDTRPFNDDFAARARLQGELVQVRAANQGGTAEAGEPLHAGVEPRATLWWTWTAPTTGMVNIDTQGSAIDTVLAVYTGTSLSGLTPVAANDNATNSLTSNVNFAAQTGVTYQIAVGGKNTTGGLILVNLGAAPANDDFASATAITQRNAMITATNAKASSQPGEPAHAGLTARRSLWYRWTAPTSARFFAAVASAQLNPVVAVYTGTALSSLTPVASDVSTATDAEFNNAIAGFDAIEGTAYTFAVDSAIIGTTEVNGEFTFTLTDAAWIVATGNNITSSPTAGVDGTIYIGSDDSSFYAFNGVNGELKWRYTITPTTIIDTGSAGVAADGTIYFGASNGSLYALTDGGTSATARWVTPLGGPITNAPAIAADGSVYIRIERGTVAPNLESQLVAVDGATGTIKWRYSFGQETTYSAPCIGPDGTIYVAGGDSLLHAVTPAGVRKWRFATDSQVFSSPSIDGEGNIYFSSLNGSVYSLTSTGAQRWRSSAGGFVSSSVALANDTAYLASYDKKLYAFDLATGVERWTYLLNDEVRASSPAVAEDGSVFIGGYDKLVHHVNSDGTLRRTYAGANWFRSSALLAKGRLYIGNNDGRLYALEVGLRAANGAAAPWPQHRQNILHAGRAIAGLDDPVSLGSDFGTGRLFNLSVRTSAGSGDNALLAGFVVAGGAVGESKGVLVRAIGPGLEPFGVSGVLADPVLSLREQGKAPLATNDNWGGAPALVSLAGQLGAFALPNPNSLDSALSASVVAGSYSAQITSNNGGSGVVLAELYDGTSAQNAAASTLRLVNLSVRSRSGAGEAVLIAGFTISDGARAVLIRGIGPGLVPFGVSDVLVDPRIEIYRGSTLINQNNDWAGAGDVIEASVRVGAFALAPGSKDAALVMKLDPGGYSVVVRGAGSTSGVALAEVYEIR